MANDDSLSISCALLSDDSQQLNNDTLNPSISSSSSTKPTTGSVKWTLRNSISSASLRRYRSPFRRGTMKTASVNSQYPSQPSFPLFRRFYLMRSSLANDKRTTIVTSVITLSLEIH